jgi:hypothetical protein
MVTRVLAPALHWQSREISFDNVTHMLSIQANRLSKMEVQEFCRVGE